MQLPRLHQLSLSLNLRKGVRRTCTMAACNNDINIDSCTLQTCCWTQGYVQYAPNLGASVGYLAIFAAFLFAQFGLGIFYRTWGFWIGVVCGLILEIIGYAGRIMIRSNPFSLNIFLLYFIPLGLGPAFLTASIYLTLARIVVVYGTQYSKFRPRTYTITFVTFDVTSLIVQAVGGSLTASADTDQDRQKGVDILIAGLTFQAFSLAGFLTMASWFALNVRRGNDGDRNSAFVALRASKRFHLFIWAVAIAAVAIFIRCVYRVVELADGFSGTIANAEVPFLILEGPLVMLAMVCMTTWHPGLVFKRADWEKANWHFKTVRSRPEAKNSCLEYDSEESTGSRKKEVVP